MGNFPLQIFITKHLLSYYCYLKSKNYYSVVKQALNIMYENALMLGNSYISNLNNILSFCDLNCSNKPDLLISSAILEIISKLQNKYSEYWKSKIGSSNRLEFFTRKKQRYERDPFLNVVKNFDVKRTYYKFRTSNYSLFIETGRYCNPVIPRERRLCKFCSANETEDELHFLLKCNLYNDLRQLFSKKT